jgi:hypothetical protein
MAEMTPELQSRMAGVKLLLCDVDGILTDASVYVGEPGEYKRFNVRDGLGIALWRREGVSSGLGFRETLGGDDREGEGIERGLSDSATRVEGAGN